MAPAIFFLLFAGAHGTASTSRNAQVMMPLKMAAHLQSTRYDPTMTVGEINDLVSDGEVECVDGMAGGFPCSNMNLVSFVDCPSLGSPLSVSGVGFVGDDLAIDGCWVSDIWGWTDEEGSEYALVGMWEGVSIVDITDPVSPATVVFVNTTDNLLDGYSHIWRDIKVVNDVMFHGAEVAGHGVGAFDLLQLKDMPRGEDVVPTVANDYVAREVGSTHNLVAGPDKIIAVGMGDDDPTCNASLAIFDVSGDNRVAPVFESCFEDEDVAYVHDAHCILYSGPDEDHQGENICVLFAEDMIYLINFDTLTIFNNFTYDGYAYVHQGWFSEDHTVLYADDELDEAFRTAGGENGDFSRAYIFDVTDLDAENLEPVSVFTSDTAHPSIDHNLYVKGDFIYQAGYTSGARVRKITAPDTIEEVAFMDLEGSCECVFNEFDASECTCDSFLGTWTYFPYFDSGITIAGGAVEGLFLLRPILNPCQDSATWYKNDEPEKNCEWVKDFAEMRCSVKGADSTLASYGCPGACDTSCADTMEWYKMGEPEKDCAWVHVFPDGRCDTRGWDGTLAAYSCPVSCSSSDVVDDPAWYKNNEPDKNCAWVSRLRARCSVVGWNGALASEGCPFACTYV